MKLCHSWLIQRYTPKRVKLVINWAALFLAFADFTRLYGGTVCSASEGELESTTGRHPLLVTGMDPVGQPCGIQLHPTEFCAPGNWCPWCMTC